MAEEANAVPEGAETDESAQKDTAAPPEKDAGATENTEGTALGQKADGEGQGDKTETSIDLSLKAPEGAEAFQPQLDEFATDMKGWLKANPKASHAEMLQEVASRQARVVAEANKAAFEEAKQAAEGWLTQAKADKTIGGDKFSENVALAKSAVDAFGDDDLKAILDQTGLGNHPALIRAFWHAGQSLKEADVSKGSPPASQRDASDILYPKS